MEGFEIIESGSRTPAKTNSGTPTVTGNGKISKGDKAMDMLSNNFDNILNLAGSIVEIKKMEVASEACLKRWQKIVKELLMKLKHTLLKKEQILAPLLTE